MSNEQKDPQSKKTTNQLGLWLSIGVAIGTSLGVAFDNIPIGVALGIMLGTAIGTSLSQKTKGLSYQCNKLICTARTQYILSHSAHIYC
ncbi:MAG: glycine zipper family protein [Anaerolineales bacterium]|uniref:glycine zipper family protein n=1 Tax=Candidatus Villigracilis proximus TaxID=3140683 RepID=UPI003134804E|nr:glycine zipper family protein [Anaerolineales bacterium]